MTKAQVLEIMGSADGTETYETKTGGTLEYLIYQTKADQAIHFFSYVLDIKWGSDTPMCIFDGKLNGWGRNFYEDTLKIRKKVIRK